MNIGENLKKLRESKKLTQQELCSILNIKLKTYQDYELGRTNPKYELLEIIKNYYKCSFDDLLK